MTKINKKKLGIYVHIPFCVSKCKYCGFYSQGGKDAGEQEKYIEELLCDIEEYGRTYGDKYSVDTIFIGGGTPSILHEDLIVKIMETLRDSFQVEEDAEITIESNPKTLTKSKLLAYRNAGINRLSIGTQSLDNDVLKTLGRIHSADDFVENYNLARECGFDNINVDLMFSVPGCTEEVFEDTVRKVIELGPEHVSFYSLQLEEGTPFFESFMRGEFREVDDVTDRKMYHRAIRLLKEAGYEHYEISNASKPGYSCKHNLKYWSMEDYLGIGANASSFMEGVRFAEAPAMEFYENELEDSMSEFVFTGLRKASGISLSEFRSRFERELWDVYAEARVNLDEYFERGLLIEDGDTLRLSEYGFDISNTIMAEFV